MACAGCSIREWPEHSEEGRSTIGLRRRSQRGFGAGVAWLFHTSLAFKTNERCTLHRKQKGLRRLSIIPFSQTCCCCCNTSASRTKSCLAESKYSIPNSFYGVSQAAGYYKTTSSHRVCLQIPHQLRQGHRLPHRVRVALMIRYPYPPLPTRVLCGFLRFCRSC